MTDLGAQFDQAWRDLLEALATIRIRDDIAPFTLAHQPKDQKEIVELIDYVVALAGLPEWPVNVRAAWDRVYAAGVAHGNTLP